MGLFINLFLLTVALCHICGCYLCPLKKLSIPLPYPSEKQSLYYKSPTGRQAGVSVQLMNCSLLRSCLAVLAFPALVLFPAVILLLLWQPCLLSYCVKTVPTLFYLHLPPGKGSESLGPCFGDYFVNSLLVFLIWNSNTSDWVFCRCVKNWI